MSGGGGVGKSKSKGSSKVQIPSFLQPFVQQVTSTAGGALGNLQNRLGGGADDLVAGFQPAQLAAQALGTFRGLGGDGLFPAAQNAALQAARSGGLEGFVPQTALDALNRGAGGFGPLAGTDTLQNTANGDFLFGGQGFNEAVQAAMRSAQPGIASMFGGAGRGGATGGLAQSAIGQSAIDAFARQFSGERANQLGAANSLAGLGLAGQDQQMNIAGLLAQLGGQGADRQLQAAGMIPGLANADLGMLGNVGGQQQAMQQARIDAPINAQMQLLQSALGGFDLESILGQRNKGQTSAAQFSFGGK